MKSTRANKLSNNPIIAAVTDIKKIDLAIKSPCEVIFLVTGNIFNLKDLVDKAHQSQMEIYIHIDLLEGLAKDITALQYIQQYIQPDGIITTRTNLVKKAKDLGLFAIQRLFLLDSISIETGIKGIKSTKPDAIEIMPGIISKITRRICNEVNIPVITGGLISEKKEVIKSLEAGAICVSTSREEIWYM